MSTVQKGLDEVFNINSIFLLNCIPKIRFAIPLANQLVSIRIKHSHTTENVIPLTNLFNLTGQSFYLSILRHINLRYADIITIPFLDLTFPRVGQLALLLSG